MTNVQDSGDKTFAKVAKRGVAISFLREGVTEVLLFPASMVVARLLTPAEFGVSTAALFFIQLSARLSDLGFSAALVRMRDVSPLQLSTVFTMNLGIGICSYLALFFVAPLIGAFYGIPETTDIVRIAAFSFLIAPLGSIPNALLTRNLRYKEMAIVDWYFCLTFAGLSIYLAWLGFSFWSLVYARLGSVAVQVIAQNAYAPWKPGWRFSPAALRSVISFALGMHSKRLLEYTAGHLDNVIVGRLMGMTALGLYDKAFSTMTRLLGRMNTGGPEVVYRIFAMIHEDPARLHKAYRKVLMSASVLGFPPFAVLLVTAPQFMVVLFGPQWIDAALPFQILCVAGVLRLLNSYASAATGAIGVIWAEVWRQALYIISMIGCLYALRDWGPVGAAWAALGSTVLMTVLMHVLMIRLTRIPWAVMFRALIPALLLSSLCGVTAWLVGLPLHDSSPWLLLAAQGLAAAFVYLLFILFAPLVDLRSLVREIADDLVPDALKRNRMVRRCIATL